MCYPAGRSVLPRPTSRLSIMTSRSYFKTPTRHSGPYVDRSWLRSGHGVLTPPHIHRIQLSHTSFFCSCGWCCSDSFPFPLSERLAAGPAAISLRMRNLHRRRRLLLSSRLPSGSVSLFPGASMVWRREWFVGLCEGGGEDVAAAGAGARGPGPRRWAPREAEATGLCVWERLLAVELCMSGILVKYARL